MTVKELKEFLRDQDDSKEVFISIWGIHGEIKYCIPFTPLKSSEEENQKVRIAWIDDCPANIIS